MLSAHACRTLGSNPVRRKPHRRRLDAGEKTAVSPAFFLRATLFTLLSILIGVGAAANEVPDGREIIEHVESLIWGRTLQADLEMTIATPRWQRTLALRAAIERPRRSFIRILAPAKEKGIGSLRIGAEMWNYLPNIERTIKIPPAMMMQPWMGSDFTNDDLVKESSLVEDYTHRILPGEGAGEGVYVVESLPRPEAAVVWGRVLVHVRREGFIPVKEEFYDERGALIRVLTFSDVRPLGGRTIPTRWEMRPVAKPRNSTTVILKSALFDAPIDPEVFTQRHLQKPATP
jgi:hypothetical protein